jgi:hypothetical protein
MRARRLLFAVLLSAAACGSPKPPPAAIPGTQLMMDFTRATGFYDSPFPCESRRLDGGQVGMASFPNPTQNQLAQQLVQMVLGGVNGFGLSSGIFFQATAALDPTSLPDLHGSTQASSPVFLMGIDPGSPDYLRRLPIQVAFLLDGGPYGPPNLLAALPLQGVPLQPLTSYVAVVLRSLKDAQGQPLGVSLSMAQLAAGVQPVGMPAAAFDVYQRALSALGMAGVTASQIAGLASFTTWDPVSGMTPFLTDVLSRPLPTPIAPFTPAEVFPNFCVYQTTINMPDYQQGTPPYNTGGNWVLDGGQPVLQGMQTANFVVTVPQLPMPPNGYPLVVFSRTGGGGNRPLVDRGTEATPGGPAITPGTGPALFYALAGWGGTSIDGPLGGLRNPTGDPGAEDDLIFNIGNPPDLRDNIRESALELALTAHLMDGIQIDASNCPGATTPDGGPVFFDPHHQAIAGHSMGATISPLALAVEPRFQAGIFDGEGGSWIENVLYKQNPLVVLPFAELAVNDPTDYTMTAFDPILSILQWVGEPADPPIYNPLIVRQPGNNPARHVLMFQGIVDTYILPPIANASSLSFDLDQAGAVLDATSPNETAYTPLEFLLDLSGGSVIPLPAQGNRVAGDGSTVTAVVIQHLGDGLEDGHEEMFQTDPPKHQYRCFLQSLLTGVPKVPPDGAATDACP